MVANYLTSTTFMTVVLLILLVKISNDMKQEKIKRMYQVLDITVTLYVLLDAAFATGFLMGRNQLSGFKLVIFLFFIVYVMTPYVWQLFVRSYIDVPRGKLFQVLEKVPLVLLFAMVVFSPYNGYVWSISDAGDYIRGPGFELFTAINLFYYLEAFINGIYILYRKMYEKEPYLLQSLLLSTIPLAVILANTYLIPLQMAYPFQPFCLVLGTLSAYLFMVDRQKSLMEEQYKESLQRALELEKEASLQAIQAGQAKSVFLANMSHDIRTPMNAILGFADMIDRNPQDEARVADAVGKIKSSGKVLQNLINDVLDLTRIENNKMRLEEQPMDLRDLTEELVNLFMPGMKQRGITYEVQSKVEHPYVSCDEGKLQRILVNVINNAMKFTPEGGRILFTVRELPGEDDRSRYEFLIRDTGIGISKEFQKRIFEAFEQEQSSTVSREQGAGLGLAIVKNLVELMGGTIEINSAPGEGTAVKIMLAFSEAEQQELYEKPHKELIGSDLPGIRILLAEDNELNMEIAVSMLEEKGAVVTWASNGQEAVEYFEQAPPGTYDMILMDVMMPVLDGLEATRRIRAMKRPDAQSIPVFAMTANAFEEDIEKSKAAGMNEHLSKPLDYEMLAKKIFSCLKYS